ncbi:MAG: ornithine carbamoyltransferase [Candidatus Anammoximicrobium sp.]|nr:ornithine carbamoyltransferase [Candidatus Anammoximicrobium sp.]
MRHLLTLWELTAAEIERVFAISRDLKAKLQQGLREPLLAGRVAGLLFEKPSLRTRVSFETGLAHLGGSSLFLGADVGWGQRESISDFTQVLSQYVDVIVCRAKTHRRVEELAQHSRCPVVNGLTDLAHPCQALADLFTLHEVVGDLQGKRLAYVGDANNVARSLLVACAKLGVRFAIASPPGYQFDPVFAARVEKELPGASLLQTRDPAVAVREADAVYTDVWASMGQEAEKAIRSKAFASYQVNEALLKQAPPEARFLHCLPARRGEEVTDAVIDGPQSIVIQQAANRLHVQKGLLVWLLTEA